METLEVFEEAIRKAGEEAPTTHTGYNAHEQDVETEHQAPSIDPLSQDPHDNSATRGRGGGRGARPRPTKAHDPARTQRQLEHTQRKEQAAVARRAWGAAREAELLGTIPVNDPNTPATTPQPPIPPLYLPLNQSSHLLYLPYNHPTRTLLTPSTHPHQTPLKSQTKNASTTRKSRKSWNSPPPPRSAAPRSYSVTRQKTKPPQKSLERKPPLTP